MESPPALTFHAAAPAAEQRHASTGAPTPPVQFDADRLYTDSYNARAFADAHWLNLRYCFPWKCWLVWTGTHWQRDTSGAVMRRAKETIKNLAQLLPTLDDKQAFALLAHIKSSLSTVEAQSHAGKRPESKMGLPFCPKPSIAILFCSTAPMGPSTSALAHCAMQPAMTTLPNASAVKFNPQATCPTWTDISQPGDGWQARAGGVPPPRRRI